jgi:hypothetical protein
MHCRRVGRCAGRHSLVVPCVTAETARLSHHKVFDCSIQLSTLRTEVVISINAAAYLEFLRAMPDWQTTPEQVIAGAREELARRREQLGDRNQLPSDEMLIEAVQGDRWFANLVARFLDELPPAVSGSLRQVPVGIINLNAINAHSIRSPSGEPLITLSRSLIKTTGYYAEALVAYSKLPPREANAYFDRIRRVILANFMPGADTVFAEEMVQISRDDYLTKGALAEMTQVFVLAHEYAHIYLGHLEKAPTRGLRVDTPSGSRDVQFYQLSRGAEFEADSVGWQWYWQAASRMGGISAFVPALRVLGGLTFFELLALVEENLPQFDQYSTHPHPIQRLAAICTLIERTGSPEEFDVAIKVAQAAVKAPKLL